MNKEDEDLLFQSLELILREAIWKVKDRGYTVSDYAYEVFGTLTMRNIKVDKEKHPEKYTKE
jgi:hypothetical protein